MSKIKLFFLLVVAICILFFIIISLPWILLWLSIQMSPSPAAPEIRQGEFPFSLTYSINGSTVVVEDTLICQYSGIDRYNENIGKQRSWTSYLLSGNEYIIIYEIEGIPETFSWRNRENREDRESFYTIIYFNPGSAGYYMGEIESQEPTFPDVHYISTGEGGTRIMGSISEDDLLKDFGIEFISWEVSPPIVNKFIEK